MVSSSTAGKVVNASGLGRYIAVMISRHETLMLTAISTSISPSGSGMISMNTTASAMKAPTTSERCMAVIASRLRRLNKAFMGYSILVKSVYCASWLRFSHAAYSPFRVRSRSRALLRVSSFPPQIFSGSGLKQRQQTVEKERLL
ncbi:Uncharacterised protein [Cedecea neteri]|uniref:Uncharacterized protein n=1 Tax=Cedecea neteri TaxID=158822 RepID=A0A2X2T312_9ENTR|nr:Uncharacterised protein [Cedecea neteri]